MEIDHIWIEPNTPLFRVLTETKLADSGAQAKRLVKEGSVQFNQVQIKDPMSSLPINNSKDNILQVGRRKFVRLFELQPEPKIRLYANQCFSLVVAERTANKSKHIAEQDGFELIDLEHLDVLQEDRIEHLFIKDKIQFFKRKTGKYIWLFNAKKVAL